MKKANLTPLQKKAQQILGLLKEEFGEPGTELKYHNSFQLLVAVMLSAQCTDQQVNKVTSKLFQDYPDISSFTGLSIKKLSSYIRSCGLFNTKARNIKAVATILSQKWQGLVPEGYGDLLQLPGVGRKTANVISAELFKGDRIAVDTHVHRVSNRLGLVFSKTPKQTEEGLMQHIAEGRRRLAHHLLIRLGRTYCKARKPLCDKCPLQKLCDLFNGKK
ncbi:endonuclease III [Candidatus Riflebacteria bacterium]